MIRVNTQDIKSFDDTKFKPIVIYQSAESRVILAYFKKGQFIPVHKPNIDLILCILEGEAEVVAGEERSKAGPNDLIIIPKGVQRGIMALSDLTALHIVQPPPSNEDHKEVHEKLVAGKFE